MRAVPYDSPLEMTGVLVHVAVKPVGVVGGEAARTQVNDHRSCSGDNQQVVLGPNNHGTFVDFQLAVDKPVSMKEALNYQHANIFLEELEDEQRGCHVVRVREHAGGVGTRPAAKELRIFIENVTASGAQVVELDFSGQAVVSSSFADEVIAKLIASLGFTTFNRKYRLSNMNDTVAGLIDTAIAKRLGSSL